MTSTTNPKWQNNFLDSSDDDIEVTDPVEKDYYSILGVLKSCSKKEIIKAYRNKSKELHPDKHMNDNVNKYKKLFQELCEAYSILKDDKTRKIYDNYGIRGIKNNNIFIPKDEKDLDLLFKVGFEDEDTKYDKYAFLDKPQCEPIEINKYITPEDSIAGSKIEIQFTKKFLCTKCTKRSPSCNACKGTGKTKCWSGGEYKKAPVKCKKCKGGGFINLKLCYNCHGTGTIYEKSFHIDVRRIQVACEKCKGKGLYCKSCLNKGYHKIKTDFFIYIKNDVKHNDKQILYRIGHEEKDCVNGDVVITYKIIDRDDIIEPIDHI